ncbi:unnamed protein product [Arctogadus glacialis]
MNGAESGDHWVEITSIMLRPPLRSALWQTGPVAGAKHHRSCPAERTSPGWMPSGTVPGSGGGEGPVLLALCDEADNPGHGGEKAPGVETMIAPTSDRVVGTSQRYPCQGDGM